MAATPAASEKEAALFEEEHLSSSGQVHVGERPSEEEWAPSDRKLNLKLDLLILPLVTIVYLLAFLDRANIGNARVAGLQEDLKISSYQYQVAITVTYAPYIASEIPSNLLLRRIGPRIYIPSLCFSWGVISTLQCLVQNYSGLIVCRFFLGLVEGGLFPGVILYLSMFYRRKELSLRIALFWTAASLAGAFSGLLAAAIINMDGVSGMRGWRWIFCLEGIFTVCWAVLVFLLLPNDPRTVKFLTPEQATRCVERLKLDVDILDHEKVTLSKVISVFKHPGLICIWIASLSSGIAIFGLAYFTPSIVKAMGFDSLHTQLMSVPPYAAAVPLTVITCWYSDKYQARGIPMLATYLLALIGSIMFYVGRSFAVRYAGLFFLLGGIYANVPCQVAWIANNTAGHTRRATAIAVETVAVNIGGIVSTWIFPTSDAPYYLFAAKFLLAMNIIAIVVTALALLLFSRENGKKETPEYRQKMLNDMTDLSLAQQLEKLGDAHPDYKYVL
ncbi:hypothetical protein LTS17_005032 [Exophiala oligosperma]